LAAMANLVLDGRFQLGSRSLFAGHEKDRVVTEPTLAARLGQDGAFPTSLTDQRRRVGGMMQQWAG